MSRIIRLFYCDNCEYLKGFNLLGFTVLFHRPCAPKDYMASKVQAYIAPPGFVSAFMRDDACTMSPDVGPYLSVYRIGPDAAVKTAWAYPGEIPPILANPDYKIENLNILEYRNIFGARFRYVIDQCSLTGEKLYYVEDSGTEQIEHPRDHLKECMRYAELPDYLQRPILSTHLRWLPKKWPWDGIF